MVCNTFKQQTYINYWRWKGERSNVCVAGDLNRNLFFFKSIGNLVGVSVNHVVSCLYVISLELLYKFLPHICHCRNVERIV